MEAYRTLALVTHRVIIVIKSMVTESQITIMGIRIIKTITRKMIIRLKIRKIAVKRMMIKIITTIIMEIKMKIIIRVRT